MAEGRDRWVVESQPSSDGPRWVVRDHDGREVATTPRQDVAELIAGSPTIARELLYRMSVLIGFWDVCGWEQPDVVVRVIEAGLGDWISRGYPSRAVEILRPLASDFRLEAQLANVTEPTIPGGRRASRLLTPEWVLQLPVSPESKLLWATIAQLRREGAPEPTLRQLADRLPCGRKGRPPSIRTVRRLLRELEAYQALAVIQRPGRESEYRLITDPPETPDRNDRGQRTPDRTVRGRVVDLGTSEEDGGLAVG